MPQDFKDIPLTRSEASRLVRFLKDKKDIKVAGGWTMLHKLTANQIARDYKGVSADEVVKAARLDVQMEAQ